MIARWILRSLEVRLALAAAAGSAALVAFVSWHALQQDHFTVPTDEPGDTPPDRDPPSVANYPLERVLGAVTKDPFHPERRRPGARFQLPADLAAAAAHRQETAAPQQSVRVIGTAVAPDGGGFAMCAWAGGSARIVRVGERVGEWVLNRVSPGAAEFTTSAGQSVVVRVPKAGT